MEERRKNEKRIPEEEEERKRIVVILSPSDVHDFDFDELMKSIHFSPAFSQRAVIFWPSLAPDGTGQTGRAEMRTKSPESNPRAARNFSQIEVNYLYLLTLR